MGLIFFFFFRYTNQVCIQHNLYHIINKNRHFLRNEVKLQIIRHYLLIMSVVSDSHFTRIWLVVYFIF